ncbi:MAG: hypothetical protein EBT59_11665 [Betaproteobacteria bacterium]|nr:hypothetical protein [Betaproteobacteria bacterium]
MVKSGLHKLSSAQLITLGISGAVAVFSAIWGFLMPYQIVKLDIQYTCRGLDSFEDPMFRGIPSVGIGPSTNWCSLDAGSRVTASLTLTAIAVIFGAVVVGVSYWRQPSTGS